MRRILLLMFLMPAVLVTAQSLNVSVTSLDFEEAYPGYHTRVKTYTLTGNNLNADVSVTAPQGFELSLSCGGNYSDSLLVNVSGNSLNKKLYVRFHPEVGGTFAGDIVNSSPGAANALISVNETTGNSSLPSGYYNSATSTGAALKTELSAIIDNHTVRSYGNLWTDYQSTDVKPNGRVWDMYTDNGGCTSNPVEFTFISDQCGNYSSEGDCYNREHSFPKSWFNDASPMYTDLYHVVPSDGYDNGIRGNYPYGETNSANYTTANGSKRGSNAVGSAYTGTVFEPADIYKGDFARIYFYMATRYENRIDGWENNASYADAILDGTTFPCYEQWFLDMLVRWHLEDPVSQKEIERNDAVYSIQNNRNPYVDHPEYVMQVWGNAISVKPEPTAYPSGFIATATGSNAVEVSWTDAAGVIAPDGYLLKANLTGSFNDPADGQSPTADADLSDGQAAVFVNQGVESFAFTGLDTSTVYHFSIWPHTNQGADINYRTVPAPPSDTALTPGSSTFISAEKKQAIVQLRIFPDEISIQNLQESRLDIMMFSSTGQLAGSWENIHGHTRISTAQLPAGLYILKISGKQQQLVRKVIVQ